MEALSPATTITPTDVALWLRLNRCDRLLSLRRREREDQDSRLFADAGVLPQAVSPLLSLTGQAFEKLVEDAVQSAHDVVVDCRATGDDPARRDGDLLVQSVNSLRPGTTAILYQARLEVREMWGWHLLGDLDLIRLERTQDGQIHCLIADSKASGSPRIEHYIQLALYRAMLMETLAAKSIFPASVDLGIVYRGDSMVPASARHQADAKRLLNLDDAYLAIADDPETYSQIARDLVVAPDSPVRVAMARTPHESVYDFGLACVGCRYTAWCCKEANARLDLSLLPHLSPRVKKALIAAGVLDVATLASLKQRNESGDYPRLIIAHGQEQVVQKIALSPAGATLDNLVLRAQALLRRLAYQATRRSSHKQMRDANDGGSETNE